MILISCPWCGMRDITEFRHGGEAGVRRPAGAISESAWGDYLYFRDNPKGMRAERWFHRHGCRQWLLIARHTVTDEVLAVWRPQETMPQINIVHVAPTPEAENRPELRVVTDREMS